MDAPAVTIAEVKPKTLGHTFAVVKAQPLTDALADRLVALETETLIDTMNRVNAEALVDATSLSDILDTSQNICLNRTARR